MNFFKKMFGEKAGIPEVGPDFLPEKEKENENDNENTEKMEAKRTKEEAQAELIEKFGMRKTSDFQEALKKGEIEKAEEWLAYVVENRENFPQYESTWNSWYADRVADIKLYSALKADGDLEKVSARTKEEAQAELIEKFGFRDTAGFRATLSSGETKKAENWLDYIVANKFSFPQYLSTWDNWLADRKRELEEAKS